MFKLFNKKEISVLERPNIKNYPKEVLEIHHEFEVASDKLLENAYEIINSQPVVNESKLDRLKKFGFNQVKEVVESVKILKTTALSKEQIELVQYYKQNYPFNKFITESQVKEICHKYNLVCGDVGRFRGFVPDVNIKDIEKFKLKNKDKNNLLCKYLDSNKTFILENAEVRKVGNWSHIFKINEINQYNYAFQTTDDKDYFYGKDDKNIFNLNITNHIRFTIENNSLQICAPVKDMDIKGLELVEGYKLQKPHVPDPVVLQPVKGGYLIITAWGDEASDPLVINENFN